MPLFPLNGSNKQKSKQLFIERLKYETGLFNPFEESDKNNLGVPEPITDPFSIPKPMIKFQAGEFQYYGKVNELLQPIVPIQQKLKPISDKNSLYVLDFVAKQFKELKQLFVKAIAVGNISKEDPYLSAFKPTKAYSFVDVEYKNYIREIIADFNKNYLINQKREKRVKDFSSYIDLMTEYTIAKSKDKPITKSSFIKTKFCPMNISGLVIEIADLQYSEDKLKSNFVSSPNFKFFQNACIKTGFSIDYYAPWRIIADIDSIPMKEAMQSMGYNRDTIFKTHFDNSTELEIENIRKILFSSYVDFTQRKPILNLVSECKNTVITKNIQRPAVSLKSVSEILDDQTALRIYIKLRTSEQEKTLSSEFVNSFTNKGLSYLSTLGISSAIKYVEQELQTKELAGSGTLNSNAISLKNRLNNKRG
jgi:hypothetical protein